MRYSPFVVSLLCMTLVACGGGSGKAQPTATPVVTETLVATSTPEPAAETLAFLRENDVWLVDADGTGERRLGLLHVQSFSWVTADELDVVLGGIPGGHYLVDLEGNTTKLPFPGGGSWSSDGTRYVVSVDQQIVVYDRAGAEVARLTVTPPVAVETPVVAGKKAMSCSEATGEGSKMVFGPPAFSADGQSVYVAANCEAFRGAVGSVAAPVYELPLDGSEQRVLIGLQVDVGFASSIRLSPDGSRLGLTDLRHGNACGGPSTLSVARPDGTGNITITLPELANVTQPRGGVIGYDWAPASDAVVASFDVTDCSGAASGTIEPVLAGLYIVKLDGSPAERLVDGPTSAPAWSPSGRYVAYVSGENFGQVDLPATLRVLDLTTRQVRDLTTGTSPAWRPE